MAAVNGAANGGISSDLHQAKEGGAAQGQAFDVAWMFVQEYFTFMNKSPERIHCFYSKNSNYTHGEEAEDVPLATGQNDIHEKIMTLGLEDSKVYISNVDAQSSIGESIIVQVIGEMSNRDGPWRKFTQTFFLAPQDDGFYVRNDIFRFLKEDIDEAAAPPSAPADAAPASLPEPASEPADREALSNEVLRNVDEVNQSAAPVQEPSPAAAAVAQAAAPAEVSAPVPVAPEEPSSEPTGWGDEPISSALPAKSIEPEQTGSAPAKPAEPEQPAGPPLPKTWANLAANNATKWGNNVAAESKGTSAPSSSLVATPGPTKPSQHPGNTRPVVGANPSAAMAGGVAQCYVKNVTSDMTQTALELALSQFGTIEKLDVVYPRNCAFLAYTTEASFRKAIAAFEVDVENAGSVQVTARKATYGGRANGAPGRGGAAGGGMGGGRGGSMSGRGDRGGRGRGNSDRGRYMNA